MNKNKEELCSLLDDIESRHKALSQCREYYRALTWEPEDKKQYLANT